MKTIYDKFGSRYSVCPVSKVFPNHSMAEVEVATNGYTLTYFRLYFENTAEFITCKEEDGVELELLFHGKAECEQVAEMLSFAGAALKELTKASAALEEHLN